jgi:hypothetical protein
MEVLKGYWWMIITVPGLALLIYILARRSMKGIAILSALFGSTVIVLYVILYPKWGIHQLVLGIVWLLLGGGWLIKDHMKRKRISS